MLHFQSNFNVLSHLIHLWAQTETWRTSNTDERAMLTSVVFNKITFIVTTINEEGKSRNSKCNMMHNYSSNQMFDKIPTCYNSYIYVSRKAETVKAYISLTGENSFSRSCESNISKSITAFIKA